MTNDRWSARIVEQKASILRWVQGWYLWQRALSGKVISYLRSLCLNPAAGDDTDDGDYNADDEAVMMMILVVMVEANKGVITFGPNPVKVWLMEMVFFNLNFKMTWTPYFDVIVQSQKEKELRF